MTGGTLLVTRRVKLLDHYKKRLTVLGFKDVAAISADRDGLYTVINEIKPRLLIIGASFYLCATPYMMTGLLKKFPGLNIAAIATAEYPADRMMWFIYNGVKSCIDYLEGPDQFYKGLEDIKNGKTFISENIRERIELRGEIPAPVKELTRQQEEVIRLFGNGLTTYEIGDTLHISERRVYNLKNMIYTTLNARNEIELFGIAVNLGILDPEDLYFFHKGFVAKPLPEKETRRNMGHFNRNIYLVRHETNARRIKEVI
jgi:DNA-binding CsgD family transcriptional regulator